MKQSKTVLYAYKNQKLGTRRFLLSVFLNFNSCNNYHKRHSFGYEKNNDGCFNNNMLELNNVAPYTTRLVQDATCLFCFVTAKLKILHDFTSHNMN